MRQKVYLYRTLVLLEEQHWRMRIWTLYGQAKFRHRDQTVKANRSAILTRDGRESAHIFSMTRPL